MIEDEQALESAEDTPGTPDAAPVTAAPAPARKRATRKRVARKTAAPKPAARAAAKKPKATAARPKPKKVAPVEPAATPDAPAVSGAHAMVRVGSALAFVWVDPAVAAVLTDKDRKRLKSVVKKALKRAKKR